MTTADADGTDSTGATILVVDDESSIRDAVCMILRDEGYRVACASDGSEALEYLERSPAPHLIILDMMMPQMDGWAFCEARSRSTVLASIPVVITSAGARLSGQAAHGPIAAYLTKPYPIETLLAIVREIVDTHEASGG